MAGVRNVVDRGGPNLDKQYPGDLLLGAETLLGGQITTVGTGVLSAAAIATGLIYRTGSTAGYADVFDNATNIIAAIRGNVNVDADVVPGSSFRLVVVNTVAFADTVAASTDGTTKLGTGVTAIAASTWREYLVTILNSNAPQIIQCLTTNGSPIVNFFLPSSFASKTLGPNGALSALSAGGSVSGTGIPAGTTVLNVNLGQGGALGVTLSANATATSGAVGTGLTFGPVVQIDGIRSGTL